MRRCKSEQWLTVFSLTSLLKVKAVMQGSRCWEYSLLCALSSSVQRERYRLKTEQPLIGRLNLIPSTFSLSLSLCASLSISLCLDWRWVSSNPCRAMWGERPIACQGGQSSAPLATSRQRCCIWNSSTALTVTAVIKSPRRRPPSHPRQSSKTLQHLLPWIPTGPRDQRPLTSSRLCRAHR